MATAAKQAEVCRILDRYIVEVVEKYELCPWARAARLAGEVSVVIEFGTPDLATWIAAARSALARDGARVALVVAPELAISISELRGIRDRVAEATGAGVAEFHPDASLDLATPARLVPFLRRSPDPLLQLVPLSLLDSVRASPVPDRAYQAKILGGHAAPPRDVGEQIALANHAVVSARHAEITAVLDEIADDRRASYQRVAIACR